MKKHNRNPFLSACLLGIGIAFLSQSAFAGRLISQTDAAEVDRVEYIAAKGSAGAKIKMSGCSKCPLTLNVDANTKFIYNKQPATMQRVVFLSGKPATVIYSSEEQRVIRVRW